MSGVEPEIRRPPGANSAVAGKRMLTEAVTCIRHADGRIKISTPLHFNPACADEPAWGAKHERANNFIAANILYGFLQSDDTPENIRSHLMTLTGRIHDPDEPDRQDATRAYLLDISRNFSEDFINTLPTGEGIIPAEQVQQWLARSISVPTSGADSRVFDEHNDHYVSAEAVDIASLPFHHHGFVCGRTAKKPTYNIAQKIWLKRKLRMDWHGPTAACESLAANVIDRFIDAQPSSTPLRRAINGQVGDFYSPFADDFLHSMPRDGGQIPVSVMSRWFTRQL